jgi:predicted amidohydrolase YtcJ
MFFGTSGNPAEARRIQRGQPGDLCVLVAPPKVLLDEFDAEMVAATVVAGEIVFERA